MELGIRFGFSDDGTRGMLLDYNDVKISRPKRDGKGSSKLEIINDYVVIDLETTGLDPYYDNIIEIGAIKVSNNEVISEYHTLINPLCKISTFITDLTGITDEMLVDAPELKDVLQNFTSFIGDSDIVAHNANFDINFLYDKHMQIYNEPFTNNFIDTVRFSRRIFKDVKNHKLSTLIKEFDLGGTVSHRALDDCICAYHLYEFSKKHIADNNLDVRSLLASSDSVHVSNIKSQNTVFDENHPLYGKTCVFTGALEVLTRKEIMQVVVDLGGINGDNVTKTTNYLILGNNDYCTSIKDGKSRKQKMAEKYMLSGQDLAILSEKVFYDML